MDKSIAQSLMPVETGHGFSNEQIEIIKNSVAKGVSDQELAYFLEVCRSTGLNPLHRQIYAIMRKSRSKDGKWTDSMTIQTGIDGYRLLAYRSTRHAGTDDAIYDTETAQHPNKATVTVYKVVRGQRFPFTATARWSEYVQTYKDNDGKEATSSLWAKMPYLMLAKVAEALALRKAFPAETSGLYTDDEMMQADRADNSLPVGIPAPVTVQEVSGGTVDIGYKKSSQDRWDELKAYALRLGFSEAVWRKAVEKYPTTSAMSAALDAYQAQQETSQEETPAEVVEAEEAPVSASQEEMAAWDQLHRRAIDAGMSVAAWDETVTVSNGDITKALRLVKTVEANSLRKVPAGKGRH